MNITWEALTIDAADPVELGHWWAETLGWHVVEADPAGTQVENPSGGSPSLFFIPVSDHKVTKNRLHLDVLAEDYAAAVEGLMARGAQRVDIGQPKDAGWVVMQDPEGNEFCVLEPTDEQARYG